MTKSLRYQVDRPVYSYDTIVKDFPENEPRINFISSTKKKFKIKNPTPSYFGKLVLPLPFILKSYYETKFLLYDLISGLTMLVFHIPQGMAYGLLSGLQPVNGLYASFFPPLVYSLFGTSRHLSIGTFSLMSLLSSVPVLREVNEESYLTNMTSINGTELSYELSPLDLAKLEISISTTLLAGLIQTAMGFCQLGFIMTFLSDALIDGFTTAAAFHVFMAQLAQCLGYSVKRYNGPGLLPYRLFLIIKDVQKTNIATLIISLLCIAILLLFSEWLNPIIKKKFKFPFPVQFLLVILGTLISYLVNVEDKFDVDIVGKIPSGMPVPKIPSISYWPIIFSDAILLAIIGFVMNAALAKIFALKFSYDIGFNQELIAYGLSNTVGSFFRCTMSAAALARTSVVVEVGMKSQIASLVSCFVMVFVLLFIGPLFQYVPKSVLAAIIIVSLKGLMMQLKHLPDLFHISKYDFFVWVITFVCTICLNIPFGLVVGFIFSLITVMFRLQMPKSQVLGQLPDSDIYKNIKIFKHAQELPGVKIIRYDAPLYFANAENFQAKIYSKTKINPHKNIPVSDVLVVDHNLQINSLILPNGKPSVMQAIRYVILDCSGVTFIDNVGVRILDDIYSSYRKIGVSIFLTTPNSYVRQMLRTSNFTEENLNRILFVTVHDAVLACLNDMEPVSSMEREMEVMTKVDQQLINNKSEEEKKTRMNDEEDDDEGNDEVEAMHLTQIRVVDTELN